MLIESLGTMLEGVYRGVVFSTILTYRRFSCFFLIFCSLKEIAARYIEVTTVRQIITEIVQACTDRIETESESAPISSSDEHLARPRSDPPPPLPDKVIPAKCIQGQRHLC